MVVFVDQGRLLTKAVEAVQLVDLGHLVIRQGEVIDIQVLLNAGGVDRLGDEGDPTLEVPAQDYLGGRLAMGLSNSGQNWIVEDLAPAEGAPGLGDDLVVAVKLDQGAWLRRGWRSIWLMTGISWAWVARYWRWIIW